MKFNVAFIVLTISNTLIAQGQQWGGSADQTGLISRSGNVQSNGLTYGRYGGAVVNDPNPYNIYSNDNENHDLLIFGNGGAGTLNLRLYDGDLKLGINATPNSILYNNGDASFGGNIYMNGNIGIGTASTGSFKLYANGNARFAYNATIGHSGTHYDEFGYNVGFTTTNDTYTYVSTDPAASIRMGYQGSIEFRTAPNGNAGSALTLTNRMHITHEGNIGIGTTTPDSKLTVKGDIHTREVKVDLAGAVGPDYVFEKDYALTSLEELKSYIDQYKHLPEIPSAKEMEENGINLKEMNLHLLKKIEELTLHLIQKDEDIELLKNVSDTSMKKVDELINHVIQLESQLEGLKKSNKLFSKGN